MHTYTCCASRFKEDSSKIRRICDMCDNYFMFEVTSYDNSQRTMMQHDSHTILYLRLDPVVLRFREFIFSIQISCFLVVISLRMRKLTLWLCGSEASDESSVKIYFSLSE